MADDLSQLALQSPGQLVLPRALLPMACPPGRLTALQSGMAHSCRKIRPTCSFLVTDGKLCPDCAFLDNGLMDAPHVEAFLRQCRAIQEIGAPFYSLLYSPHVAAIMLTTGARVIDCDARGESFFKSRDVLWVANGHLVCAKGRPQQRFDAALRETAGSGRTTNVLLNSVAHPEQRYSAIFIKLRDDQASHPNTKNPSGLAILCGVTPLDRRRFATAGQLMELFGLSGAEARLTRALCQGDSVEEYARDHCLKLPTVRTQIRSVFAKTGTERQATLIRLIAGIPVARENGC